MFKFKYQIFDCMGENLCRPGFDSLKEAVDTAKEICEYRGEGEELYVERVNGEWDFERIRRIFHDGNGVKVVKMSQKV